MVGKTLFTRASSALRAAENVLFNSLCVAARSKMFLGKQARHVSSRLNRPEGTPCAPKRHRRSALEAWRYCSTIVCPSCVNLSSAQGMNELWNEPDLSHPLRVAQSSASSLHCCIHVLNSFNLGASPGIHPVQLRLSASFC